MPPANITSQKNSRCSATSATWPTNPRTSNVAARRLPPTPTSAKATATAPSGSSASGEIS